MNEPDIIIIGAGASGIFAAKVLSSAGKKVIVLEARNRKGGRIHTIEEKRFSALIEEGAEFIHGEAPLTRSLLNKAGISYYSLQGETIQVKNGVQQQSSEFIKDFPLLFSEIKKLKGDIPFAEFLEQNFRGKKFKELRETAARYVEGYDAADINRISSYAVREEWEHRGAEESYIIKKGYSGLIEFLAEESADNGCEILLNREVVEIRWTNNRVKIICRTGEIFSAQIVLVTIPAGVLRAHKGSAGYIDIIPEIPAYREAFRKIGVGSVIKVFIEFERSLNLNITSKQKNKPFSSPAFIFADSSFNAWWMRYPEEHLYTGWLAGPKALRYSRKEPDKLLSKALDTLSYIFKIEKAILYKHMRAGKVYNWNDDVFSQGAYVYETTYSKTARNFLSQPLADTVYFSGEALYDGWAMGTVEAAIQSGQRSAQQILRRI